MYSLLLNGQQSGNLAPGVLLCRPSGNDCFQQGGPAQVVDLVDIGRRLQQFAHDIGVTMMCRGNARGATVAIVSGESGVMRKFSRRPSAPA